MRKNNANSKVSMELVSLAGGLDLVSPSLSMPPGKLIDSVNFEPDIEGGYRRMFGIERMDGGAAPSQQNYSNMTCTLTGSIIAGNIITGATSGATAAVLLVNNTTELIITKITGTFVAETIRVGGVSKGTTNGTVLTTSALTPQLHAYYLSLSANYFRSLIGAVPGSGPVRGAWYYNGNYYAFRNNAGGTACLMYKATSSGWTQVTFGRQLQFVQRTGTATISIATPGVVTFPTTGLAAGQGVTFSTTGALPTGIVAGVTYYVLSPSAGTFNIAATVGGAAIATTGTQSGVHTLAVVGTQVKIGDTVTGATSGAVGVVTRSLLQTGVWNTAPIGSLVMDTITGTFANGEALTVSGKTVLQANGADKAISLLPGGRFQFENGNFSGGSSTFYMYFTDGVNNVCEFDGTRLVPIITGLGADTPTYLAIWRNMLVIALDSQVQLSAPGQPYSWTALTGASLLALGAPCTGLKPQIGTVTSGTLTIFTQFKTFNLYGTSVLDFNLATQSPDSGAIPYSCQNIGNAYYLDTKGVQQITTSQQFGGFIMSTITRVIQPLIDSKLGMLKASCVVKGMNQYRLFFNDGTGILVYMQPKNAESVGGSILIGDEVGGIMPFDYSVMGTGWYLNTVESIIDSSGIEQVIAGGSDGYVYTLNVGTSFDGNPISAHFMMPFNSSKSPRVQKHYKRGVFGLDCLGTANVTIGYDLDYADGSSDSGVRNFQTLLGSGGIWDIFTWDKFNWDSPSIVDYEVDMPGDGKNIGILLYGNTDQDLPYTIQNITMQYIIRRQAR